jgi:hypothetical protein
MANLLWRTLFSSYLDYADALSRRPRLHFGARNHAIYYQDKTEVEAAMCHSRASVDPSAAQPTAVLKRPKRAHSLR